jgi:hypothetical protein
MRHETTFRRVKFGTISRITKNINKILKLFAKTIRSKNKILNFVVETDDNNQSGKLHKNKFKFPLNPT